MTAVNFPVGSASAADSTTMARACTQVRQFDAPTSVSLDVGQALDALKPQSRWQPQSHEFQTEAAQSYFSQYKPAFHISAAEIIVANFFFDSWNRDHNVNSLVTAVNYGHVDALREFSFLIQGKYPLLYGELTHRAAAQGNVHALYDLSVAYCYCSGLKEKNLPLAKSLCIEAARLGHSEAMFNVEVDSLLVGRFGEKRNFQEGVRRAKLLADAGNKRAKEFMDSIARVSPESLIEADSEITKEDLEFLHVFCP